MDYKKYIRGYVATENSFDHSPIDNDEVDKYTSNMLDYLNESSIIPDFESDKDLYNYMRRNISYKNFTKLMSPEEVYKEKKGSCHDQVMFEMYCLRKMKYSPKSIFLIEYNDTGEGRDNVTHSFVYYERNNKVYWFENAWGGQEGIHEFKSLKDIKEKISKLHEDGKFGNYKKYPKIEFTYFKSHKPGESLQQLVDIALNESYIEESVKIQDQIGESEIEDVKTVISSLNDGSFKDFKFIDMVYCDIRYRSRKPIAFLTIRAKMINNSTVGYVSLAVNPKYQNQGIGKSLATKAVSWFKKERGIQFLEWHCLQDNEASRKLANSTGFREYIARNEDEYARFTMESSIYESYIEEKLNLLKKLDEQKVSEEILDTIKPIILTSQNKSKTSKLGLDLKCESTEVDSGMVFILVLDGPQDKRDIEEARSLLKDLASKCKSKLSDIISKVDIGDGDEGCLFFTMDKGKIRRKRKDLLESYVEEKFHMMSNPYRKKVIKNLNQYDYIFSKYGSNYKDQRDKEVGNVSGNLSTDKVGNFFVNHFDNDKKRISPGISYWCYKSITSGNLDKLKSDIRSLNREIKSKGIKFDLYGINPNEKVQKYVWVFLYFLDNRRKSLDESYIEEIEESDIEEDVEQEFSPSSFVKRSSLPAKNQKNHAQYLRKKAHSNKTNNATAQSELPKFNQIGELSFEEVAKGVRVKPIFIVTSYTNTPFGKAIKTFTHAQYTHAAIAFDTSLEQLYSFNADPKVTTNGNKGGISRESLSEYINTYDKAIIQVNCILCKESDFNIVKNTLDDIFRKESDTRYGYMNILNILIGRAKDTGMSMVCSQFVSYILHKADIKLVDKPDNLVEPKDLSTIVNPRVYKLYEGAAKDYDKKKIDRIFRKLKTKALLIKESLLEYCV